MGRKKKLKPILTTDKYTCYWCQRKFDPSGEEHAQLHHIYFGKNRKISDKMGFVVYLCENCHKGTNGVHGKNGHEIDTDLKRMCQWAFEQTHSRDEFMKAIGRSYI